MKKKPGQKKVYEKAIKNWPEDERPREKLFKFGEHTLSNTELLAILLHTGVKGESAIDLARKIIQKFKTFRNMSHTDPMDWKKFKGLGQAKIAQIKAAIEIGRRFREQEVKEKKTKITSAFGEPVYEYDMVQGIEDGYLPACEIIKREVNLDLTGVTRQEIEQRKPIDPYSGKPIREVPREHYGAPSFEDIIQLSERVKTICQDLFKVELKN